MSTVMRSNAGMAKQTRGRQLALRASLLLVRLWLVSWLASEQVEFGAEQVEVKGLSSEYSVLQEYIKV
jgi:hypothetical protein